MPLDKQFTQTEIDLSDAQAKAELAEANLAKANAELALAQANAKSKFEAIETARLNYGVTYSAYFDKNEILEQLKRSTTPNKEEITKAQLARDAALEAVNLSIDTAPEENSKAQIELKKATANVNSAQSELTKANAVLASAKVNANAVFQNTMKKLKTTERQIHSNWMKKNPNVRSVLLLEVFFLKQIVILRLYTISKKLTIFLRH